MILNLILNENEKEIVNDINSMGIGRTNKSNEKEVLYKGVKALEQLEKMDKLNNEFIQKLTSNRYSDKAIIHLAKEFTQELALLTVYKIGE